MEHSRVVVRNAPSVEAKMLAVVTRGDVIQVSGAINEAGQEWIKVPKGSSISREGSNAIFLAEEGFVLTMHPDLGRLVKPKNVQVNVKQVEEEGFLTKEEMQDILASCHSPADLVIPLEAKTWSVEEFTNYVMSGGMVRPKGCSIPDATFMLNTDMSQGDIEVSLAQAAAWIAEADAILVGSGAGMGVDSGLATFRGGKAGVWPGLQAVGLAYEEICDPKWFVKEPELAWAFWDFCHSAYRETKPHQGYDIVRQWAAKAPLGSFSFTSNIDSHWITSGWDWKRVIEVHGAVAWLQCSRGCCPDVWAAPKDLGLKENPRTHRAEGAFPQCPKCGKAARPCVQMFGNDRGFAKGRRNLQITRYDGWLKKLEARHDAKDLRVVCLELGCGLTVPTVRKELESVVRRFKGARIIRVNPENPGLAHEFKDVGVSLPLAAGVALRRLDPQLSVELHPITVILWDIFGGGIEFVCDKSNSMEKVMRRAEHEDGVEIEYNDRDKPVFAAVNLFNMDIWEACDPGSPIPENFIVDLTTNANSRRKRPDHTDGSPNSPKTKDRRSSDTQETKDGSPKAKDQRSSEMQEDTPKRDVKDPDKEESASLKLGTPGHTVMISCRHLKFKSGLHPSLAARCKQVSHMLDDMNQLFSRQEYQDQVRKQVDRKGVTQMVKEVQFAVMPKYGVAATDKGVFAMQALTGIGIMGSKEIQKKADDSMEFSYMIESFKLPAMTKEKVKGEKRAESVTEQAENSQKETLEAETVQAATPLSVTLIEMGQDTPGKIGLVALSNTTISELRQLVLRELGEDPARAKGVKFIMKLRGQLCTMRDDECVLKEMYVVGLTFPSGLTRLDLKLDADTDGDSDSADDPSHLRVEIIDWFQPDKKIPLSIPRSTLVSQLRVELKNKLRMSKDLSQKLKFVHRVEDFFLPLADDEVVKQEIFCRNVHEGDVINLRQQKTQKPKNGKNASAPAFPLPPLKLPGWPDWVVGAAAYVFATMTETQRIAWAGRGTISFWLEWGKIHQSPLFSRCEDAKVRQSIFKIPPTSRGGINRAASRHAWGDPVLSYYAAEDRDLISVWFVFGDDEEEGAHKAPTAVPEPVHEVTVNERQRPLEIAQPPAVSLQPPAVAEELEIQVNVDVDLDLAISLRVASGTTVSQLKKELVANAIMGNAPVEDIHLGIPSSGEAVPLADATRLSREHLVLEIL